MNKEIIIEPCDVCREKAAEPGYAYPLCPKCRRNLINREFPIWVIIVAVIVAAPMAYSASRFPVVLKAVAANKAAQKAGAQKDFQTAIVEYQKVLALFPDSDRHKEGLAICYIKTGRMDKAVKLLPTIENKMYSAHVLKEMGFKLK